MADNYKKSQLNIWELIVLTIFVSIMFMTALFVWHEMEIAKLSTEKFIATPAKTNNIGHSGVNLNSEPKYCQQDSDCIAVEHPQNACYKEFFNKDATEAIAEYKLSLADLILPGCPQFGQPVCVRNRCTHDNSIDNGPPAL